VWLVVLGFVTMPLIDSVRIMPAWAQGDLILQVAPASLTLEPGDVADVELLVTNGTNSAVTITEIDVAGPPRVTGQVSGLELPAAVAAGASVRAQLRLDAAPGVNDAEVGVVVQYRFADSPNTALVTKSLTIKSGQRAQAPDVTLVGFPDKLDDGQSRSATVRIANATPFGYRHLTVSALDGDDVGLVLPNPELPSSPFTRCPDSIHALACLDQLIAGEVQLLDVRVKAHESVKTGKQHVSVVVTGSRDIATGSGNNAAQVLPPATVVATGDVELTVFGVDALSPFGIGTLFVLPGLVAVLVFLLFARAVYPRKPSLPDTIELKDLRALPIVVPVAALAYLILWLVLGRDLTRAVSTFDVALLFVVGFLLGLVVWAVMAYLWWLHSGRKQFAVGDNYEKVLERLKARRSGLSLPQFWLNGVRYLYLVPTNDGRVLAAPSISYAFLENVGDKEREAFFPAIEQGYIDAVLRAYHKGQVRLASSVPTGVVSVGGDDVEKMLAQSTASGRGRGWLLEQVDQVDADT
jgi:hypothetical protein